MEKYEPQEACLALAVESYKAWLGTEARTDDISVIVLHFQLGAGLTCAREPSIKRVLGLCPCGSVISSIGCTTNCARNALDLRSQEVPQQLSRSDLWSLILAVPH